MSTILLTSLKVFCIKSLRQKAFCGRR